MSKKQTWAPNQVSAAIDAYYEHRCGNIDEWMVKVLDAARDTKPEFPSLEPTAATRASDYIDRFFPRGGRAYR
jgi:hypothetical protein